VIPALIARQARRTPQAAAVLGDGEPVSYAELDLRARRLAGRLRAAGTGRDAIVGVHAERSVGLVVGMLGVLYAGAAVLPLEPGYPRQRLESMLADVGGPPVVATPGLAGTLPGRAIPVDPPGEPLADVAVPDAADLAYVMFTSGSTGRPKGVLSTHGGLANRLAWMQDAFAVSPGDRVLHKTPIGFDVSIWELLWPLAYGAPLVLARPNRHWDFPYLAEEIVASRVTIVHFVPSLLRRFLRVPGIERCTSLRAVLCSGEALTADLRDAVFAALPAQLHNLYGPTEASIDVTHWPCDRHDRSAVVPIGRPISRTRVHVLDEALRPVPDGTAGELCLAGAGLARGYLGRPELTAERFPEMRLPGGAPERVYRTGDLGRRRPDGVLEYLGRLDRQVKLNGVRIEPAEVEAVLHAHPRVRASIVRACAGQLVAWVETDLADPGPRLRPFLARQLPDAMIPATFVPVTELPLTPNGKLDDHALPAPPPAAERDGALPELVAQVWRELLHVDALAPDARFFDLGGHSLLVVELHSRLEEMLCVRFSPAELIRYASLGEQVSYLATLTAAR
jgi:amino acid adenylation domain-containing protein